MRKLDCTTLLGLGQVATMGTPCFNTDFSFQMKVDQTFLNSSLFKGYSKKSHLCFGTHLPTGVYKNEVAREKIARLKAHLHGPILTVIYCAGLSVIVTIARCEHLRFIHTKRKLKRKRKNQRISEKDPRITDEHQRTISLYLLVGVNGNFEFRN